MGGEGRCGLDGALERGELGAEERGVKSVSEAGVGLELHDWGIAFAEEAVAMVGCCILRRSICDSEALHELQGIFVDGFG